MISFIIKKFFKREDAEKLHFSHILHDLVSRQNCRLLAATIASHLSKVGFEKFDFSKKSEFFHTLRNNFVRKGKCKMCGKCCRNITFSIKEDFVTTEKQFEQLKKLDKKYHNFYISDVDEKGTLLFTCKALGDDNKCGSYFLRSQYCRSYPKISSKKAYNGLEPLDNCGFYFEPKKEFKDFLTSEPEKN